MGAMSERSRGRTIPVAPLRPGVPMDAYDYGLPEAAVAQFPLEPRSAARLLVAPGVEGNDDVVHATMADLPGLVRPGDVLVVNDTEVLTARLHLVKPTGGAAEVLLVEPAGDDPARWEAMVRPGRRLPPGTLLAEPGSGTPVVEVGPAIGDGDDGRRIVRLIDPSVVERSGTMPLPPYLRASASRPQRYQTVYATPRALGERSAAAPTAGLHFTPELLEACRRAGATVARLDLAIGLDTFRPITADRPADHVIHSERFAVPAATMAACAAAERVIAVGTTAVRALESAAASGELSGRTSLYIRGDFRFRLVDVLVTNFHLPRSSLLLLVEAFAGPVWRSLYATALAEGYRFLSFGDAMVVGRFRPGAGPA